MTAPLGFVVLSKRPNPYTESGYDYTAVSAAFKDAGEAENARDYHEATARQPAWPVFGIVAAL